MDRALPRPGSYRAHIPVVQADALDLDHLELGSLHRFRVRLVRDGLGDYLAIPVIVAQGREPGPVLGVTAAVHGNELNGIPVIQRLMAGLDVDSLCGTVVAVPIVNLPGYQENRRELVPHMDLNRLFPGRPDGNVGQIYAHRFVERVIRPLHYLIDMHTAMSASGSIRFSPSELSVEMMIWTSLRMPLGKSGRSGRSVRRAARIAFSVGRPSRLMNPPGILPAAYIFSS